MQNEVKYVSRNFDESQVVAQYIGTRGCLYILYDVNKEGYTVRETAININCYPQVIQDKVKALRGKAFNQVKL